MTVSGVAARHSVLHAVGDQLQMSTIQLHALALGRAHGLDAEAADRLGLIVTEMATNIARHAGAGHIILRPLGEHASGCVEILALDKGSGITDMSRAMRRGGSPANLANRDAGLAGIRQLANLFDIYSHPGRGTAVVAHVGPQTGSGPTYHCADSAMHGGVGVVCVPLHGEEENGDAWAVDVAPGRMAALLVDGLGHGPGAALAALTALSVFGDAAADAPESVLRAMHAALRDTRGAALSLAVVDQSRRTVRFCGVGNVEGRVITVDATRHLIPQNGIAGHTMPHVQPADVPWPSGGQLVMHSDGISSRWRADRYPGLLARHPALLAGVLFRDFAGDRDDATVLVLRDALPPTAV